MQVTDEAVEAAAKRIAAWSFEEDPTFDWDDLDAEDKDSAREGMRAALEAAAPLLGPRPPLDREAVHSIVYEAELPDQIVDGVMALARPMPTREEIDALLQEWRVRPPGQPTQQEAVNYRRKMRNAVLTLINGGAK